MPNRRFHLKTSGACGVGCEQPLQQAGTEPVRADCGLSGSHYPGTEGQLYGIFSVLSVSGAGGGYPFGAGKDRLSGL